MIRQGTPRLDRLTADAPSALLIVPVEAVGVYQQCIIPAIAAHLTDIRFPQFQTRFLAHAAAAVAVTADAAVRFAAAEIANERILACSAAVAAAVTADAVRRRSRFCFGFGYGLGYGFGFRFGFGLRFGFGFGFGFGYSFSYSYSFSFCYSFSYSFSFSFGFSFSFSYVGDVWYTSGNVT